MKKYYAFSILVFSILISNAQNSWTQKANFGGSARKWAAGFSIGSKGYVGTGEQNGGNANFDFWEYDSGNDTWTQKANVLGNGKKWAYGYSVGTIGYIIMGYNSGPVLSGASYDPFSNTWSAIPNFTGTGRYGAAHFSIGAKLYVVAGDASVNSYLNDTWEFNTGTGVWTQKANFGGSARRAAAGFSIGTKGYVGTGINGSGLLNDMWEYDQTGNLWVQKANFPGAARQYATGFKIGSRGYLGAGYDGLLYQDFYEYDNVANSWTSITQFPGLGRWGALGFEINGKGYFGIGGTVSTSGNFNDWWEYTPASVGIDEGALSNATCIFPNPSAGRFIIDSKLIAGEINVYNSAGKKVFESKMASSKQEVDLSGQLKGVYLVEIIDGNSIYCQKVVIQ